MYPKVVNSSGVELAVLNNIIEDSDSIKRVVNGEFTFTFECYEAELKTEYFDENNMILVDGQFFDMKYTEQRHNFDVRYHLACEHVNYRLEDGESNKYEHYLNTGTPAFILADILAGTEFSVGVIDFSEPITIQSNGEVTKKGLIYDIAKVVGGEIDYSDGGFTINIRNTIGQDRGYEVRFGKNLLGVTKIVDRRGEIQVTYEVDIVELKNSNEYINKQLQDLEVIDVGDTVRIVDEVIGLDIQNRIISIEYSPIKAINTKLEIANKVDTLLDYIHTIKTTTVQTDKLYNNVSISNIYGFKAERSDLKAKVEMNATVGLSVFSRADINNPYSENLTIDPNGNIIMTGILNIKSGSDVSELGFGNLAYQSEVDWDNELINIPNSLQAPSGDGLYLSDTNLGFYKAGNWRTYMDNNGNFYLGGAAGKLQWNSNLNLLTVNGVIHADSGSFTGDITSDAIITGGSLIGGTITGGTVQTATSGRRIKIGGNKFEVFNSSGNLNGPVFGEGYGLYGDIYFYSNGNHMMTIYDTIADGFGIQPVGTYNLFLGAGGKNTYGYGNWTFTGTNVNLNASTVSFGGSTVNGLNTTSNGSHSHGIPNGTILMTADGGSVTFYSDGSHSHTVKKS
jgi:hypothetical protein